MEEQRDEGIPDASPGESVHARRIATTIAGVYLLVGALWILLSDLVSEVLAADLTHLTLFQTAKGVLFMVVTAVLLHVALVRILGRVERAQRSRAESEARYRAVVEDQTEFVVRWEPGFRLTFVNEAYCRFFGRSRGELIGTSFLELVPEDQRDAVRAKISALTRERPVAVDEHRVLLPDGTERWTEWTDRAIFDARGEVVEYQSVGRDVTERHRAEEGRKQLEEQLNHTRKMQAIGELAGGVAHDLNNLLTPILSYADLLDRELPEGEEHREAAHTILLASRRARDLTRQILAFARRQVLSFEPLDLGDLVTGIEPVLQRTIRRDVEIRVERTEHPVEVYADRLQIEQVLANLAMNAQDAMEEGGTLVISVDEVEIGEERVAKDPNLTAGRYGRLTVSDTGGGMDAETLERIFEPFFTTKGSAGGTGLGLSVCHGIVQQHGGHIDVSSRRGVGTAFRVLLPAGTDEPRDRGQPGTAGASDAEPALPPPAAPAAEEREAPRGPEAAEATAPPAGPPEPRTEGRTVLVCDDSDLVRGLVERALGRAGHRVISTGDPSRCTELAEEHRGEIDLLLTDMVMPGTSGPQLYERVAELCPGVAVLYMSGYSAEAVEQHDLRLTERNFVQKPFSVAHLVATVERAVSELPADRGRG